MTISEFFALCKKKLYLLIILPLIIAIGAGAVCYCVLANEYTSTVSLYVLQHNQNTTNSTNTSNGTVSSSDVTTSQQLSNDIAVLVKTNRITNAVTNEMGIQSLDPYKIKVSSSEKNRVINISATGKNAKSTAEVCNSIARQTADAAVETMGVDAVNIIEEAQASNTPSGPNRPLIILIAFLAGLVLAVAIIIVQDMLDNTVKSVSIIKDEFDLPILAQIPTVKKIK